MGQSKVKALRRQLEVAQNRVKALEAVPSAAPAPGSGAAAVAGGMASGTVGTAGPALSRQSTQRNHVVELPRREKLHLTGENRRKTVRKTTSLYTDVPYLRGAARNVASYLGPITPRPATLDAEWNKIARVAVNEYLAGTDWDCSGKLSFAGWQELLEIYKDRDGDGLVIFTEDEEDGTPNHRIIPSIAIDNPAFGRARAEGWQDGVRIGAHHRHLEYHILREEDAPEMLTWNHRDGYVVPRNRCFLHANWDGIGHPRGVTRFIASGNTIVDMQMMDAATHQLFNLAARIGLSFTTDVEGTPGLKPQPLEGRFGSAPMPANVPPVQEGGEPPNVDRYLEQFMGEGPAGIELDPGQKINMHALERDLPDLKDIKGSDFERIAMAYELPVQTLFCIFSGVFNLTGPGFRVSMAKSREWRAMQLSKREPLILRAYGRIIDWMIRTKRLPKPKKDPRWWLCETNYSKDFTIDEGRAIKDDALRLQLGLTSPQELAREYGRDALEVVAETQEWIRAVWTGMGRDPSQMPVTFFFPKELAVGAREPAKDDAEKAARPLPGEEEA